MVLDTCIIEFTARKYEQIRRALISFSGFSNIIYIVGTHKNRLVGTVLMSTYKICYNWWIEIMAVISFESPYQYALNFRISSTDRPVHEVIVRIAYA